MYLYDFTFLLNIVAGRLSKNVVMTGNVLLNGKKKGIGAGYGVVVSKVTCTFSIYNMWID